MINSNNNNNSSNKVCRHAYFYMIHVKNLAVKLFLYLVNLSNIETFKNLHTGGDGTSSVQPQSTGVTATISSPQKIRFPHLAREGIGFRSSPRDSGPRATPTFTPTGRFGGTFTPRHPSPLAHSITSPREPKLNFPRGSHRQTPLLRESERGREKSSSSSLDILTPSATMVPLPTEEMEEEEELKSGWSSFTKATPTPPPKKSSMLDSEERRYRFSPGKVMSPARPPLPPPVSDLRESTPRSKEPEYVFSPPFTRSAARRAAAVSMTTRVPTAVAVTTREPTAVPVTTREMTDGAGEGKGKGKMVLGVGEKKEQQRAKKTSLRYSKMIYIQSKLCGASTTCKKFFTASMSLSAGDALSSVEMSDF